MDHRVVSILSSALKFTTISNDCLRDPSLSFKAKGLLTWLLSHHNDFTFTMEFIYGSSTDKRRSVDSAIKELESQGYLYQCRTRDTKRFVGRTIIVTDDPKLTTIDQIVGLMEEQAERSSLTLHTPDLEKIRASKKLLCKNASRSCTMCKMNMTPVHFAQNLCAKCTTKKEQERKTILKHHHDARGVGEEHPPEKDLVADDDVVQDDSPWIAGLDDDASMPDRGSRDVLPPEKRADYTMFKQEWARATKQQWDTARNGDLLLFILRYWNRTELHIVMKSLTKKRRTITNPLAYFMKSLEMVSSTPQRRGDSNEVFLEDLINTDSNAPISTQDATEHPKTNEGAPKTLEELTERMRKAGLARMPRHVEAARAEIEERFPDYIFNAGEEQ